MNRMFKHKFLTGIALVGTLFLGSACTDEWDDHYKDNGVNNNGQTLYQMMKSDAELSEFCEVLEACGVVDSLLNSSRVYTVWAPVNGSFDKDNYLSMIQSGKSGRNTVLIRFIEQHIANYLHTVAGAMEENAIRVLNDKVVDFVATTGGYTFSGSNISPVAFNLRASNGVLHKLEQEAVYRENIWEYIANDARIDSLANFLYSFNIRTFDENKSIEGPISPSGEVTYIDSVFNESNVWFGLNEYGNRTVKGWADSGFGDISSEDSSYIFFAPVNEEWNRMVENTSKYYNYYIDAKADTFYYDSLRHMYARKAFCNYLVFSTDDQKYVENEGEMLAAYRYTKSAFAPQKGNRFNEIRRSFKVSDLMANVVDTKELSNGSIHITEKLNYSPYDLWFDTIKIEGEIGEGNGWVEYSTSTMDASINNVNAATQHDSIAGEISGERFLMATPAQAASRPQLTYKIPNTLSAGKYKIGIVVVPTHIGNNTLEIKENTPAYLKDSLGIKPSKIRAQLKTRNDEGKSATIYDTNKGATTYNGLQNDPTRIDTIYLYDLELDKKNEGNNALRETLKFGFDFCEYGLTAKETETELVLTSDLRNRNEDADWERRLLIDCILLIPVIDDEVAE